MLGLSPQIELLKPVGNPLCNWAVLSPVTPEQLLGYPQPLARLVIPLVVVFQ